MNTKQQDIFKHSSQYDAICVTTNGITNSSGALVMGAGVAKEFVKNFPGIQYDLGKKVSVYGNRPFIVYKKNTAIVSFPTKNHWKDNSDLQLIKSSAETLVKIADSRFWTKVALPAPGVGMGKLKWKDVERVLDQVLDDRFDILFKPRG